MGFPKNASSLIRLPIKDIYCYGFFTVPLKLKRWRALKNKNIRKAIYKNWLWEGKMALSRAENPCFLLFLFVFQALFIFILYRGGAWGVFRGFIEVPLPLDYSKTEDVYTNLSLFTHASDKESMPYCMPRSPIFGRYKMEKMCHKYLCFFLFLLNHKQVVGDLTKTVNQLFSDIVSMAHCMP